MNYWSHCDYKTNRTYSLKRHIGKKHASILNQENVDEDTTGTRVPTLFTEPYEIHVKD